MAHKLVICLAVLIGLPILTAGQPRAEVYSYKTSNGVVVITDQKPKEKSYELLVEIPASKKFANPPQPKPVTRPAPSTAAFSRPQAENEPAIARLIDHYALQTQLSSPLLRAIVKTESNFQPRAVSPKGASGLMQLMPDTWRALGVSDPFDPEQNIRAGAIYFRQQYDYFRDVNLALAAYNAGPEAVLRHGGPPPYEETQNFIQVVNRHWENYRLQDKNGRPVRTDPSTSPAVPASAAPQASAAVVPGRPLDYQADDLMVFQGEVVRIVRGDTLAVRYNDKNFHIRLYGLDCPDEGQPYADASHQVATDLALSRKVTVFVHSRDPWRRIVGVVVLPDGRILNHMLIGEGLAWHLREVWPNDRTLQVLEAQARAAGKGVWSDIAYFQPGMTRNPTRTP